MKNNKILLILCLLMWLAMVYAVIQPPKKIYIVKEPVVIDAEVSGYSSSVWETDSSPEITASNWKVREGVIANNCLPFHTKVTIGARIFSVEDRMNRRYDCSHYDVWFPDRESALEYGRRNVVVKIYQ